MLEGEDLKIFRRAIGVAFVAALAFAGYAMFGGFDSPAQRVASETRKCRTALSTNLVGNAEGYCSEALRQIRESKVGSLEAGDAFGQLAVLRVVQKRLQEAAEACRSAIPFWQEVADDGSYRIDRARSGIGKCNQLIEDVRRQAVASN